MKIELPVNTLRRSSGKGSRGRTAIMDPAERSKQRHERAMDELVASGERPELSSSRAQTAYALLMQQPGSRACLTHLHALAEAAGEELVVEVGDKVLVVTVGAVRESPPKDNKE